MALSCGADAVVELPFAYAVSSAQFFALGGLCQARAIGADVLSFGIESDPENVMRIAKIRSSSLYCEELMRAFKSGESYAKAAEAAGVSSGSQRLGPNDILACEYVAAARSLNFDIGFCMVKRAGAEHGSLSVSDNFASARAIRESILANYSSGVDSVSRYMPEAAANILNNWLSSEKPVCSEDFSSALCAKLRTVSPELTDGLPFAKDGLGRLIRKNAMKYNSWETIVRESTSKRYTSSRISRLMVWVMASGSPEDVFTEEESDAVYFKGTAPYVRVLGIAGPDGERVLSEMKARAASASLVTSPGEYLSGAKYAPDPLGIRMLGADIRAQAVYGTVLSWSGHIAADRDYTEKFMRIRPL